MERGAVAGGSREARIHTLETELADCREEFYTLEDVTQRWTSLQSKMEHMAYILDGRKL